MESGKKKILFIINPISGVGRQKIVEKLIPTTLNHHIFEPHIRYTERQEHATEIAKEGICEGYDIIVAVGGDGSVNEVAKAITGTQTIMGVIPCGSGNGFARCLKISVNPEKAIKTLNQLHIKTIDTALINNEIFVSIAGVGYDALIAGLFAREGKRGLMSYMKVIAESYLKYKPESYRITIDGNTIKKTALFVCVANSNQYGYNTFIAPEAKIDDGLLDICIMQKIPILEAPLLAPLLFSKNIDKTKYIEIIKAKELSITFTKKHLIHIDGDPKRLSNKLDIKIVPNSLNIITP